MVNNLADRLAGRLPSPTLWGQYLGRCLWRSRNPVLEYRNRLRFSDAERRISATCRTFHRGPRRATRFLGRSCWGPVESNSVMHIQVMRQRLTCLTSDQLFEVVTSASTTGALIGRLSKSHRGQRVLTLAQLRACRGALLHPRQQCRCARIRFASTGWHWTGTSPTAGTILRRGTARKQAESNNAGNG